MHFKNEGIKSQDNNNYNILPSYNSYNYINNNNNNSIFPVSHVYHDQKINLFVIMNFSNIFSLICKITGHNLIKFYFYR